MMNYSVKIVFKTRKKLLWALWHRRWCREPCPRAEVHEMWSPDSPCCRGRKLNLERHCSRLIDLGYNAGPAKQTETSSAADRRAQMSVSLPQFVKGYLYKPWQKRQFGRKVYFRIFVRVSSVMMLIYFTLNRLSHFRLLMSWLMIGPCSGLIN